jgi:hypothetical protein
MTNQRRRKASPRFAMAAVAIVSAVAVNGCRTSAPVFDPVEFETARDALTAPLPGDPAALYKLRVPTAGGLRMALLTSGPNGRLTISESMGSALSVTAWTGSGSGFFYDMREGCRLESADLSRVLGIGAMPLPQAVLLLGGRLPATTSDSVVPTSDSKLLVQGDQWAAEVTLASEPWRVMTVREVAKGSHGWSIVLGNHTGSVPGTVRLATTHRRWAELELIRLEWHEDGRLPALPEVPWCVVEERQ